MAWWRVLLAALTGRKPPVPEPAMRAKQPAEQMPLLWFCPTPGAPDAFPVLLDLAQRRRVSVIQLYESHLLASAPAFNGGNVFAALEASGVLQAAAAQGVPVCFEAGAIKEPEQNDGRLIDQAKEAFEALARAGRGGMLAMDEPILAAQVYSHPPMGRGEVQARLGTFLDALPDMACGLVEAYPATGPGTLLWHVEAIRERLAFVHLDVDYNALRKFRAQASEDLRHLRDVIEGWGVPFGVCVWGCDDRSEATWLASARQLFGFYQETFGARWPRHVLVQSWSAGWQTETADHTPIPGGVRTIPSAAAQFALLEDIRRSLEP